MAYVTGEAAIFRELGVAACFLSGVHVFRTLDERFGDRLDEFGHRLDEFASEFMKYPDSIKTCPDCAEAIKVEAKVCRHCAYRFEDRVPGSAP